MTYFQLTYTTDKDGIPNYFNIWETDREDLKKNTEEKRYSETRFAEVFPTEKEAIARKKVLWAERVGKLAIRKAKKEEEKAAKIASKVAKKEAIVESHKNIHPEIKKIVSHLYETQKERILVETINTYTWAVNKLKTIEGLEFHSPEFENVIYFNPKQRDYRPTWIGQMYYRLMEQKTLEGINKYTFVFKSNYKKIVEKMIQDDVKAIMESFLFKMESKLTGVIKDKEIKNFQTEGMHRGFINLEFTNGSRFHMSNSIEWGSSKYGVPFQRFPCRFHDVTFSDGSKMMNPSEAKMDRDF